ncbi:M1 family metallopeptidase [Alkaliphilus peptidifermentans]|uniref:Peptidase family M1 n=1 Tax=Alkaliphilus peptidifermentans DSM 18978 TaxID=1120976 RepID=A0A1G5HDN5_9FIRM|nr:M1 family metallopeptidase [Alkaliphilus peptidifermentans]SCY61801.1 Peptidase family M1 [Alkaliphilus peptidifermentans DSM 18978]
MNIKRKLISTSLVLGIILTTFFIHSYYIGIEEEWVIGRHEEKNLPFYEINAEFNEESMKITANQRLQYRNNTDKDLSNIYLHLYPNTFRRKDIVPFEKKEINLVYPNGFSAGWIDLLSVKENGRKADFKVMGEKDNLLRITLKEPLRVGKVVDILIDFDVKIPNVNSRLGYGEDTVNISNWYPILSVYDERGWNLDPYYSIGDPFYSDIAIYDVTITIPLEFKMATTGDIIETINKKEHNTYKIRGEYVRDFALILSKGFEVHQGIVDGINVNSFTLGEEKKIEALQYGIDSIKIFNSLFGKYPYKQVSIVACDFFLGGMEYPNLVMISKDLYEMKEDFPLEYVIAHEIAHQWWYGIVGNNEVREPWLDEALTEYSTLMYFEEKYGEHIKEQIFEKMIKAQYENFIEIEPDRGEGILRSLREFESNLEYSSIVYSKGAMFIEEIRNEIGDKAFIEGLREYFETYQFKNATTSDFFTIMQSNTKKDIKPLFNEWLNITFE